MTQILSVKTKLFLRLLQRRIFQTKNMLQDYLKPAGMFRARVLHKTFEKTHLTKTLNIFEHLYILGNIPRKNKVNE